MIGCYLMTYFSELKYVFMRLIWPWVAFMGDVLLVFEANRAFL